MPKLKTALCVSAFCALTLLSGCASKEPRVAFVEANTTPIESLGQLQNLQTKQSKVSTTAAATVGIRMQALKETAMSVGAQGGLAWRSKQISREVDQQAESLRRVFDFNALMLKNNVQPPVLTEGRKTLKLDNPGTIRLAARTYKIVQQARFVTTPANWRTYLKLNFPAPKMPDNTLLPENRAEQKIWNKYAQLGWESGIEQANTIFANNLARLKRDFNGMVLYRQLLAQRIVTQPYVARTNLGITGGGSDLRIQDQVLRISALPQLQANSKVWRPVVSGKKVKKVQQLKEHRGQNIVYLP